MKFTQHEIGILSKFAGIETRQGIYPDMFQTWSESAGCMAYYKLNNPYDFEPFGIFNVSEFLKIIDFFKDDYEIDFNQNAFLEIANEKFNINYNTSSLNPSTKTIPPVPLEAIDSKYNTRITEKTIFNISWIELNEILSIKKTLGAENVLLEVDSEDGEERIKFTISKGAETKNFNYSEYFIANGIKQTEVKGQVKLKLETNILVQEDYVVEITPKITKWTSESGVVYFIFPIK